MALEPNEFEQNVPTYNGEELISQFYDYFVSVSYMQEVGELSALQVVALRKLDATILAAKLEKGRDL